jgi:hypothetical protein
MLKDKMKKKIKKDKKKRPESTRQAHNLGNEIEITS